jgi:alpha-N-arabinofuranosidase
VKIPSLSASASRSAQGTITLSLVNLDPRRAAAIAIDVAGREVRAARGRVITAGTLDARPAFGQPDPLEPAVLDTIRVRRGALSLVAPAKSVITLEID